MRAPRFDPVRTIEACYEPDPADQGWLARLLRSLAPLDMGMGTYAKTYDLSNPADVRVNVLAEDGPLPDLTSSSIELFESLGIEGFRALHHPHPPVQLMSQRMRGFPDEGRRRLGELFGRHRIGDVLGVLGGDHDGRGVLLAVVVPRGSRPRASALHRLRHVAAHLVAARRLRMAASSITPDDAGTDAVLEPSGAVADARDEARSPAARDLLRRAVLRAERARGSTRRTDPDEAVALWRGLVDGTWSLVDYFDSDRRRFVLARRNPPGVTDPRALGPRERSVAAYAAMGHSNKYIAYLLGIAPNTVASHLRAAEEKLGFKSRSELIRLLGGTPLPVGPRPSA